MKFALALFSAFLFTSVATATQLPASTFNEGEVWMDNQLSIQMPTGTIVEMDWDDMSLADMIDLCLDMEGFWNHSTNMCEMRAMPSAEEVMEEEVMEVEVEAEAMDMEEEMMEEMVPMTNLSNSTFNEGETWFGY